MRIAGLLFQTFLAAGILLSYQAQAFDARGLVAIPRPSSLNISNAVESSGGWVKGSYVTDYPKPPLNKMHSWRLTLNGRDGAPLQDVVVGISALMPEHVHGMNTSPVISESDDPGVYLIEGMKFHMPGWWRITLDLSKKGGRDLMRFNVLVGE